MSQILLIIFHLQSFWNTFNESFYLIYAIYSWILAESEGISFKALLFGPPALPTVVWYGYMGGQWNVPNTQGLHTASTVICISICILCLPFLSGNLTKSNYCCCPFAVIYDIPEFGIWIPITLKKLSLGIGVCEHKLQ